MAFVAGTVVSVSNVTTPSGRSATGDTVPQDVFTCFIGVNFVGTYVTYTAPTTDGGLVSVVTTAIQNARRNGKTVTLLSACGAAPGLDLTAQMMAYGCLTPWEGSGTVGAISCKLSDATLVAEHGQTAVTAEQPTFLAVTFKEV